MAASGIPTPSALSRPRLTTCIWIALEVVLSATYPNVHARVSTAERFQASVAE